MINQRPDDYIEEWRREFSALLDNRGVDEEKIHQYLVSTPIFLPLRWPYQNKVFSKLALGSEYVTDFAFARKTTLGLQWYFVEIEHPNDRLFTKKGNPSAKLTHGIRQLRDWEMWFRRNLGYAQHSLPFSGCRLRTVADPELVLVIGRRSGISAKDLLRLEALSRDNLEIMTYDRLLSESGRACLPQWTVVSCSFRNGVMEQLGANILSDGALPHPDEDLV